MSNRRTGMGMLATQQDAQMQPLQRVGIFVRVAAVVLFVVRRAALLKRLLRATLSCLTIALLLLLLMVGGALVWLIGLVA